MSMSIFSIYKTSSYEKGKRDFESYAIDLNGNTICTVHREKAEELFELLRLALNDRKEAEDEKK